jgi:hypothetical protein
LWHTNIPSQAQYAATFAGIFLIQSAIAYALPEQCLLRKIALVSFIGIGTMDTMHNLSMGLHFVW